MRPEPGAVSLVVMYISLPLLPGQCCGHEESDRQYQWIARAPNHLTKFSRGQSADATGIPSLPIPLHRRGPASLRCEAEHPAESAWLGACV